MLRSELCDYSDLHIVMKGTITVELDDDDKRRNKKYINILNKKYIKNQ